MGQQIVAWLVAVTVVLAVAAGQPWATRRVAADAPVSQPVLVTVQLDESAGGEKRTRRAERTRADDEFIERNFPVADLISGPPNGGPAFGEASELMRLLRKMTGPRHWRDRGQMEWIERHQLLRVRNREPVVEEVKRQLAMLRNTGSSRVEVTVRLLILPADCEELPLRGSAQVLSSAKARRLWKKWRSHDADRTHEAEYSLADRDIVYVWTSAEQSHESLARGLNAVVQPSPDGRGARLTPYPFAGDEQGVDWPALFVGVGQSAVFDVPAAAAPHDVDRVLALVRVDSVSPTARSGDHRR